VIGSVIVHPYYCRRRPKPKKFFCPNVSFKTAGDGIANPPKTNGIGTTPPELLPAISHGDDRFSENPARGPKKVQFFLQRNGNVPVYIIRKPIMKLENAHPRNFWHAGSRRPRRASTLIELLVETWL
jgi:hypothetical protein